MLRARQGQTSGSSPPRHISQSRATQELVWRWTGVACRPCHLAWHGICWRPAVLGGRSGNVFASVARHLWRFRRCKIQHLPQLQAVTAGHRAGTVRLDPGRQLRRGRLRMLLRTTMRLRDRTALMHRAPTTKKPSSSFGHSARMDGERVIGARTTCASSTRAYCLSSTQAQASSGRIQTLPSTSLSNSSHGTVTRCPARMAHCQGLASAPQPSRCLVTSVARDLRPCRLAPVLRALLASRGRQQVQLVNLHMAT
mmetsp:Transcript_60826/g.177777  ORF Transcript_60826/g.177777 Transcript_60826/m.177777 type:complete len:254 (-) Transcript_60826:813-1574(-)